MASEKITLGQAIDQTLLALSTLDDSARITVLTAVCMQLDIQLPGATRGAQVGGVTPPIEFVQTAHSSSIQSIDQAAPLERQRPAVDIRTLKEQKNPKSARQMACLVAYYLQEIVPQNEQKDSISAGDLEKFFKQAGYRLPERLDQVLVDSKAAGYFDTPSRGNYKLNAVGHNLVVHGMTSAVKA